jgi:hypothetical protein
MVAIRGRRLPFGTEHSQLPPLSRRTGGMAAYGRVFGAGLKRAGQVLLAMFFWYVFFGNIFF